MLRPIISTRRVFTALWKEARKLARNQLTLHALMVAWRRIGKKRFALPLRTKLHKERKRITKRHRKAFMLHLIRTCNLFHFRRTRITLLNWSPRSVLSYRKIAMGHLCLTRRRKKIAVFTRITTHIRMVTRTHGTIKRRIKGTFLAVRLLRKHFVVIVNL